MRAHWVWVTRPEFYLDDSGDERADLAPGGQELGEGWWTCHPDTRTGDLILLYRTAPKSDISYLFEAASDARVLDDRPPGTITRAQQEELAKAACREDPELALRYETMREFNRRSEALWEQSSALSIELDRLMSEYPGLLRTDADSLPAEARRSLLDYEVRERENNRLSRELTQEEVKFFGVPPLPDDVDDETDEGWHLVEDHIRRLNEASHDGWASFWDTVLDRAGLPRDTMVWEADEFSGAYVCEWKSRAKLDHPIRFAELKKEPRLQEWSAIRGSFQRRVWEANQQWDTLIRLIEDRNPGFLHVTSSLDSRTVSQDIASERALEDALTASDLSAIGPDLELVKRQQQCAPHLWSIDLLCRDRTDGAFVVVELKVVRANEAVHSQTARYVGWVREHLAAPGQPVRAIVVSDGHDDRFRYALAANPDFSHLDLQLVLERLRADESLTTRATQP